MKRLNLPLFVILSMLLAQGLPTRSLLAQDKDDDDGGIEINEPDDDGGYDEKDQEKKNEGLAGRGKQPGQDDDDAPPPPKLEGDLQARINEAIKKGVAWLEKAQLEDGSWGPVRANKRYDSDETGDWIRDPFGPTAFAIYTLAKCEVKRKDPTIQKGLKYLEKNCKDVQDNTGKVGKRDDSNAWTSGNPALTTYESAAIVLMLETLYTGSGKLTGHQSRRKIYTENPLSPPDRSPFSRARDGKDDWRWMNDRILHLTVGRTIGGGSARGGGSTTHIPGTQNPNGGWRYGQANGDQDLSATQVVLLALRAASQAGYPIDRVAPDTWEWAANFAKACQNSDGSFCYQATKKEPWTACMDACGIGILLICKEQIELTGKTVPDWLDDSLKRGIEHLDKVWDPRMNKSATGQAGHHYYSLYAVERVGDLSGRHVFNQMDWYLRGALFLLEQQAADGSWTDAGAFPPRDVLGTCYALLFLKRATPPVVTISEKGG